MVPADHSGRFRWRENTRGSSPHTLTPTTRSKYNSLDREHYSLEFVTVGCYTLANTARR